MSPPADVGAFGARDDGEDLLAAEYVLGVLDAEGRRAAQTREQADPAFAREVEAWTLRLGSIASQVPLATAPEGVWRAIERRLGDGGTAAAAPSSPALGPAFAAAPTSNVVELGLRRGLVAWRRAAVAVSALAAALIVALVWPRPAPAPGSAPAQVATLQTRAAGPASIPAPAMTARLASKAGGAEFVVVLESARTSVLVAPASITARRERSPELWLLPTGGKPVPLGLVSFSHTVRLSTPTALGGDGRLTLAVSIEPLGGSPTGQPTGPVVATGALQSL